MTDADLELIESNIASSVGMTLYDWCPEDAVSWRKDAEALVALVRRLRAALGPFANQADICDHNEPIPDTQWFKLCGSIAAINLGDCRRAREALGREAVGRGRIEWFTCGD